MKKIMVLGLVGIFALFIAYGWMVIPTLSNPSIKKCLTKYCKPYRDTIHLRPLQKIPKTEIISYKATIPKGWIAQIDKVDDEATDKANRKTKMIKLNQGVYEINFYALKEESYHERPSPIIIEIFNTNGDKEYSRLIRDDIAVDTFNIKAMNTQNSESLFVIVNGAIKIDKDKWLSKLLSLLEVNVIREEDYENIAEGEPKEPYIQSTQTQYFIDIFGPFYAFSTYEVFLPKSWIAKIGKFEKGKGNAIKTETLELNHGIYEIDIYSPVLVSPSPGFNPTYVTMNIYNNIGKKIYSRRAECSIGCIDEFDIEGLKKQERHILPEDKIIKCMAYGKNPDTSFPCVTIISETIFELQVIKSQEKTEDR